MNIKIIELIRRATLDDLIGLEKLTSFTFREAWLEPGNEADLEEYVSENFNAEHLRQELNNPEIFYFLLEANNEMAGYLKLQKNDQPDGYVLLNTMALHRLYIKESYRNKKLGGKLLDYAIQFAKQEGRSTIWLGVWNENNRAIRFYKNYGFEKFGNYQFVMGSIVSDDYLLKLNL
jgi:diamine N-acetyltransferase